MQKTMVLHKQNIQAFEENMADNISPDNVSSDNVSSDNISSDKKAWSVPDVISLVWFVGMLILAVIIAVRYIQVYMKKRYAVKHRNEYNVYVWPDNTGACTVGMIRPAIYIPHGLDAMSEHMMIEHERMHIKRRDYLLASGYMAALLINWLNPLMWVVVYKCRHDIELACDEEVLAGKELMNKKIYAGLLIKQLSENKTDSFPVMLTFRFGSIKTRIIRIGKEYKMTVKSKAAMYIASLLVVALSMTACGGGDNKSPAADIKNNSGGADSVPYDTGKTQGVDNAVIDYADSDKVIFSDSTGLYVYDLILGKIIRMVDADEYGLGYTQGDNAAWYTVNKKADTVYIMVGTDTKYIYDIENDVVKESKEKNSDPYQRKQDYLLRSDNEPKHVFDLLNSFKKKNLYVDAYDLVEVDGQYSYYGLGYKAPLDNPNGKTELELVRINPDNDDIQINSLLRYEPFPEEMTDEDNTKNTVRGSLKTYYELSEGTYECEDHIYKYRLEISGRMPNAAKDSTFVYLSNLKEITFEQAWKASGLSSNREDYFDVEDAVLVDMK